MTSQSQAWRVVGDGEGRRSYVELNVGEEKSEKQHFKSWGGSETEKYMGVNRIFPKDKKKG